MPDLTPNFGFRKPLQTEDYNIDEQNYNWGVADNLIGVHLCTSTSRPSNPKVRQQIYETDTGQTFVWNGNYWVRTTPGTVGLRRYRTGQQLSANSTQNEFLTGMESGAIWTEANRLYKVKALVEWHGDSLGIEPVFRIRQDGLNGPVWGKSPGRLLETTGTRYTTYIEAAILTGNNAGNRSFYVTGQRVTSGSTTMRIYGSSDTCPFVEIELMGGASGIMTDV